VATRWHVRLFDGPVLSDVNGLETRRFRSHKVGALLAYLALNLDRSCPREELYEALWPEEDPRVVANRFRVTLASLRRHLEPDGTVFGSVLDVREPGHVRLRAEAVTCDTIECERLLQRGDHLQAAQFMAGPLLPGFYEEWATPEQARYVLLAEDLQARGHVSLPPQRTERSFPEERPGNSLRREAVGAALHSPSLPLYLTRFWGRESECRALSELIQAHPLVSLVGMGGIGKTRLAVEAAKEWGSACLFLSLVSLPDPERLYDVVLQSLGVAPQTDISTEEQTVRVLNRRGDLLLILDNAEHLLDAVAALALRLLAQVPTLRLLVTSRQRLSVSGEAILLLPPLEMPGPSASAERLAEFASFALFVDRARNARPDFTVSERNMGAIIEICKRLEGIPLALELAAARITAQTPQQIAHSLVTGLTDLKARQHGLSPRHQSLRAVIQGSLNLLTEAQRAFFPALSVFQGSCSVEAAAAVTDCAEADLYLHQLTLCSLIAVQEDERLGIMRYSLLETLRQFAAESIDTEENAHYRERHAHFFLAMVMQADLEDFHLMDRLEADHENLLAAMEWFLQFDQAALRPLLVGILNLWANRGYHRLALEWIAQKLPNGELIRAVQETGTVIGLRTYVDVGRYVEAENVARVALQVAADPISRAWALNGVGYVLMMQEQWDPAIVSLRAAIDQTAQSDAELSRPVLHMCRSHMAQALNGRALYAANSPDPLLDYQEAERHLEQMHTTLTDNNRLLAGYYSILMRSLWGQRRMEEGDLSFAQALQIAVAHRHLTGLIYTIEDGASRLAEKGSGAEAVQLLAAADALQERIGCRSAPYLAARVQKDLEALRSSFGNDVFDRYWRSGLYTPLEVLIPSFLPRILAPSAPPH
jgi:predicted ATPase